MSGGKGGCNVTLFFLNRQGADESGCVLGGLNRSVDLGARE